MSVDQHSIKFLEFAAWLRALPPDTDWNTGPRSMAAPIPDSAPSVEYAHG